MGIYRLILAALVALSHTGLTILGFNEGVVAVISFFILSGFTMEALLERYYGDKSLIKYFYVDRALKLFPQYLFYLIITLILNYFIPIQSNFLKDLNASNILLNVLILPLGFYMYNGLITCILIPPTWSLGLELTFYLAFPFVYLKSKKVLFSILSIFIFVLAYLGVLNTDNYGYRLLPGVLFIFLIGSIIKSDEWDKYKNITALGLCVCIGLFINIYINSEYQMPYNKEVLLGIIIGIPVIIILKNIKTSKLDTLLGNLSYGVFLNHFFVMYMMFTITGHMPSNVSERIIMLLISILLAFGSDKIIEEPFMKKRRTFRKQVLNREIKIKKK